MRLDRIVDAVAAHYREMSLGPMDSMRFTLACACMRPRPSAKPLAIRTSHLVALAALARGLA